TVIGPVLVAGDLQQGEETHTVARRDDLLSSELRLELTLAAVHVVERDPPLDREAHQRPVEEFVRVEVMVPEPGGAAPEVDALLIVGEESGRDDLVAVLDPDGDEEPLRQQILPEGVHPLDPEWDRQPLLGPDLLVL